MRAAFRSTWLCVLALVSPWCLSAQESPTTPPPTPQDYTSLVEHPDTLVLTNTSDRPIIAFMVSTVTRGSRGHEAKTGQGTDTFRAGLGRHGVESGILEPGESVTLPKPTLQPGEHGGGPGSTMRHYVGLVAFEGDEAIGDPDLVERLFERRRSMARQAAAALDALENDPEKLYELSMYRNVFSSISDREDALAEIRRRAREDYRITVDHLRPQDLAILEREEEEVGRADP